MKTLDNHIPVISPDNLQVPESPEIVGKMHGPEQGRQPGGFCVSLYLQWPGWEALYHGKRQDLPRGKDWMPLRRRNYYF